MERILYVNACVRPESRTGELARHVLDRLDGETEEVRLFDERIPPLDWEGVLNRDAAVRSGDLSTPSSAMRGSLPGRTRWWWRPPIGTCCSPPWCAPISRR